MRLGELEDWKDENFRRLKGEGSKGSEERE